MGRAGAEAPRAFPRPAPRPPAAPADPAGREQMAAGPPGVQLAPARPPALAEPCASSCALNCLDFLIGDARLKIDLPGRGVTAGWEGKTGRAVPCKEARAPQKTVSGLGL